MKFKLFLLLTPFLLFGCSSETEKVNSKSEVFWTSEKQDQLLLNREDQSVWDQEMFKMDLEARSIFQTDVPIEAGVFPTPSYDLIAKGSFGGIGMFGVSGGGDEKNINDKTILYNSFYVNKSDATRDFVATEESRMFFQIILLTDFIDTIE